MTEKIERPLDGLPKWAQQEITRLRADNEAMAARLAAGPSDSDVFADPYSDVRRPLGRGTMIQFGDIENGAWNVELKRGILEIHFQSLRYSGLAILPSSSSLIRIAQADES